jgi:DNA-binding GntR family transcriptional regulator
MSINGVLGQIRNVKLRDEVVARIRAAIVAGKLLPGQRLTEEDLARDLGVSRSPVREALVHLEQAGLVVNPAARGTFVRTFTAREIRELFSLRAGIETMAAELALPRLAEGDLRRFEQILDRKGDAYQHGDIPTTVEYDLDFHEAIVRAADHRLLLKVWGSLRDQLLMLFSIRERAFWARDEGASRMKTSHMPLIEALRASDLEAVRTFHRALNGPVAEDLVKIVEAFAAEAAKQPASPLAGAAPGPDLPPVP